MNANATLKELAEVIREADSVLLFPHDNADGDAIGSCVGLCLAIRSLGADCMVLMGEPLPGYIDFLDYGCCTTDIECMKNPDVCLCVDCSGDSRISGRLSRYLEGKKKLCIDHHLIAEGYGELYYIDENEAATAGIIYKLIREFDDVELSREMRNAIYTGLSTDTGNFRYSNTTAETLRIAADLMEEGIDHNMIIVSAFQNRNIHEIYVQMKVYENMELLMDGRCAVSYITEEMLRECGAEYQHAETAIDCLRDIENVEIAAMLKEKEPGTVKCSLRAKSTGNVVDIASFFGGGGHVKAAGYTFRGTMDDARRTLKEQLERSRDTLQGR